MADISVSLFKQINQLIGVLGTHSGTSLKVELTNNSNRTIIVKEVLMSVKKVRFGLFQKTYILTNKELPLKSNALATINFNIQNIKQEHYGKDFTIIVHYDNGKFFESVKYQLFMF